MRCLAAAPGAALRIAAFRADATQPLGEPLIWVDPAKASATYYTPRALSDLIVRRTLAPLVEGASTDQILRLRVPRLRERREQLGDLLAARKVIERAKGRLMEQFGLTEDQAQRENYLAIMADEARRFYAVQFHPEKSGRPGLRLLRMSRLLR